MKRESGVLLHISSLPGRFGCGAFGAEAKRFIDFLCDCGFSYWQTLPFCMPDECGSPYKSYTSFGANPYFIDLTSLYEIGLLSAEEIEAAVVPSPYLVDFERLFKTRIHLLKKAASRVRDRSEIINFVLSHPELASAAEFLALKEKNGGAPWQEWTDHTPERETLFAWQFIQFEFFRQWRIIKEYAASRSVKIIGDLPIYVSSDSADAWANRSSFLLDERGYPTSVAGVPPDYFSADGQLWGNPLYNYQAMKKNGFAFWRERISHMCELFDGVRIDHFRALESYFSIPQDAESARSGKWVKAPGRELVEVIKEAAGGALVIAEDLGDITPEVRELVEYSGFPCMRIIQFGFLPGENSLHLPHNYPENSVAYTGTHDNNTLLGYIYEMDSGSRRRFFDYIGASGDDFRAATFAATRALLASAARLAILPIQDVFAFGADTRMNTPGVAKGNWQYRITAEQLEGVNRGEIAYYLELYGRKSK